jgi:iron complex outermembrane recepter protein
MKSILSAVIGATLALSAIDAGAQATPGERQVSLTIESASLATALDKWAQQSGFQIFVQDWEATKNLPAKNLKGTFTAQDALEQLLAGTSLTYMWIDSKTVSIRKRVQPTMPGALQRTSSEGHQAIAVAKFSGDWPGYAAAPYAGEGGGGGQSSEPSPGEVARPTDDLEEVVVVGSLIRGLENRTAPLIVLSKDEISATGIGTTSRLLETLPQNFSQANEASILVPGVTAPRTQGSAINLRGLGEGTTLVLLNGRRMASGFAGSAVDISALPLSAIDRVEVMTDGASALYGSDAVGGVVNFVLRSDFEGSETNLRTAWADGGVNEYRGSQALGQAWDSGNALVSVDYYKRDLLPAKERAYVPDTSEIGSLLPEDENYSAMFSGRQDVASRVSLFADALYTHRDSYNESGDITIGESFVTTNPQLTVTGGVDLAVSDEWQIEIAGSYASNNLQQRQNNEETGLFLVDSRFGIRAGQIKADGPLLRTKGGAVRMAIGADWRSESFRETTSVGAASFDQIVRSAFGELFIPLVGEPNRIRGARALELSLAARYDQYSNFGSSLDPRFGLMWEPVSGLRLRGSYGTSYVAPRLSDYSYGSNVALATTFPDPESASGLSHQLWVLGTDVDELGPQESESYTFGVEFVPPETALRLGLNYYDIKYHDRISSPPVPPVVLGNPSSFGSLIIRDPTVSQVNDLIEIARRGRGFIAVNPDGSLNFNFDPTTIDVIVDVRRRNLSLVRTNGLDFLVNYGMDAWGGSLNMGLTTTYVFKLEQQATSTSESIDTIDTYNNPPNWRLRASLGWRGFGWGANLFANYTDSYTDNRTTLPSSISSYTTVDIRFESDLEDHFKSAFFSGLRVAASVQNLLDEDPPRTVILESFRDPGFDGTNASPLGRYFSVELTKTW